MKNTDKRTRIAFIAEEGFNYFTTLFVTSTMLGYILDTLGFSDALQGIISTVATFTCGAQLFSLMLVGHRVKRIVTIATLINQATFALLYLLPLFDISPNARTAILLVLLFAGHIIGNAVTPVRITWLMTSVENSKRGSFTALKEMISLAGGILISLVFGRIADIFRDADGLPTTPYYIICAVALIIMTGLHTVSLLFSAEKPLPKAEMPSLKRTLYNMSHDASIIKVIGVGLIWNIALGFCTSFFASYLREELSFSFTIIAAITTLGSICRILVSPLLGKIADKYSFSTSMTISFVAVAIGFLFACFTMPSTKWLYLVYACLFNFSMAGINSGVMNLIYDYVSPPERTTALSIKNAIGGIVGFLTALLAGSILNSIQSAGGFKFFGITLYAQQVLSAISFLVTLLLILYMRLVIKPLLLLLYFKRSRYVKLCVFDN